MSETTRVFPKMAPGIKATVRFVKEIERHPCLYDQKSVDYTNRELKRKTWIEIAKKFNISANECRDKWVKIRIAYIRTLRPSYNKSRNTKTPYYLANHLKFIVPFRTSSNNILSFRSKSESNDDEADDKNGIDAANMDDEQSNNVDENLSNVEYGNSPHQVFVDVDDNYFGVDDVIINDNDTELETKETILNQINKTKVKKASNTNDPNSGRIVKKRPCCDNIECNPRKMFLLSLLPDVETFTEIQMRSFRRHMIELIDNVLSE